jgi:hypothetical protein
MTETPLIVCDRCGASRASLTTASARPRLPRGWKILQGQTCCPTCVSTGWLLRAHLCPIAGPVDADWPALRAAMRASFAASTACANWMVSELYARDVRREPDDVKLRPMPKIYLYPEARRRWPELASQSVADLEQRVKRTYQAQRYELLWLGARTLASFRYPQPVPLPAQMIAIERTEGGAWHLSLRLTDRRWTVRLRTGPEFRRQVDALETIESGTGVLCGAVLDEIAARPGDHRSEHAPARRLVARLVIRQPITPTTAREPRVLTLRTTRDRLWVGSMPYHPEAYVATGDALRAVIAGADRRLDRIDADLSVSRRWIASERERVRARRQAIAAKAHQAVLTHLHRLAAQLATWARARGVTAIVYEDRERGYLRRAPWDALERLAREKAAAVGIAWSTAAAEASDVEPLASTGSD